MKKFTILLLSLFFIAGSVFAQKTNDGGSTGGNNKGNKPKDNTDGGGGSKGGDNTCMNTALSVTGVLFGAYQNNLLGSTNKRPWVSSFELMAHGGVLGSALNAVPRVRLNYGALSGDVRYDYIKSNANVETQNVDILAEFNIIAGDFKMALGQGVMYNVDIKQSFHESFVGIDMGVMNRQVVVSPEFRFVYDWNNKVTVSSEFTLKGGFRILNMQKLAIYINAAGGYRYFGTNNVVLNGGLDFIFQ